MKLERIRRGCPVAGPAVLALVLLSSVAAAAPADGPAPATAPVACRIVDYGADVGNALFRDTSSHHTGTNTAVDVDGDGSTDDDSVAAWPLSWDEPLVGAGQSDYDAEAVNAIFYGGMVDFFANVPDGRLSEGMINQNHELRDDFNFMGGASGPNEGYRAYGLFFWKKEDFLNGGDAWRVTFDADSLFGVHVSRYWDGYEETRGVVRDGDRFYISEATCAGVRMSHVFHPARTRWAPYHPQPPLDIAFEVAEARFEEHAFRDVTAVGFYVAQPTLRRGPQQLKWHAFEAYAVVNRSPAPSLHAEMVRIAPADARLPPFYTGRTEVPYALWKRIRKWAVSNQYLFDLGRPGYVFDTDGDMGSMALCDGEYDARHPVAGMTWLDAVAWCNAFSEYEGKTPCYYHDAACSNVLRKTIERDRPVDGDWKPVVHVKWEADGYRLPTAHEWRAAAARATEKAGTPAGGNGSPRRPAGEEPGAATATRTHPVGALPAGASALHDLFGNVWEYVWDVPGDVCDTATQTRHTALGGGFNRDGTVAGAPVRPVLPFGETPWRGHCSIGLRVARREAGLPDPPTAPERGVEVPEWTVAHGDRIATSGADAVRSAPELPMVALPDGGFVRDDGAHVTLSPFFMSATEIPFRVFRRVQQWAKANGYELDGDGDMGSMDWQTGQHAHGPDEPVADVTWHTAMAWCNALSELAGRTPCYYTDEAKTEVCRRPNLWRIAMYRGTVGYVTGKDERRWLPLHVKWEADGFRLPTEAEWVYAMRGGRSEQGVTRFWDGPPEAVTNYAWVAENSEGRTHPVGTKAANPYGLYDLIGNVREWVWDWPGLDYYRPRNPKGGDDYELFGKRLCGADYCTPAGRAAQQHFWQEDPSTPRPTFGFRVVRCEAGAHPEKEPFTPRTVLEIDRAAYDPLQGQVYRANLRRDGHFQATGVPKLRGVRWSVATGGKVRSSPVVVDGVVFVGSDDKHVYALDARTGAERWRVATGGPVRSSAAVADGVVYIGSDDGSLHALQAATGEAKWVSRDRWHRPMAVSPAVAHGVVFAGTADGGYWAADAETGAEVWRFRKSRGPDDTAAPAVVDGRVYLATGSIHGNLADIRTELPLWHSVIGASLVSPAIADGVVLVVHRWLMALDLESGRKRWEFQTEAPRNSGFIVHAAPAAAEGRVFFGSDYAKLYAVDLHRGSELWRFETGGAVQSAPSVAAGVVYFGCTDGKLYALDAETGALRWTHELGAWVNTSPWVSDGAVFVGCDDGKVVAVE